MSGRSPSAGELLTIDIGVGEDLMGDTLGLPSARGVAVLESADGRVVQIISSADVRRLVRARLEAGGGARRADLSGVVKRVRAAVCGSTIESDLAFLEVSRELASGLHRAVTERWVGWFAHIDPESGAPRWVKTSTRELEGGRHGSGRIIGPFADKHAAARAMEALDYMFDLCRYPKELERSPHGKACAYKGMGLCPAACDGSEPISAIQVRAGESADAVGRGRSGWRGTIESEMAACAASMAFERAEVLKRKLEKSADLDGRALRWADDGSDLAWVIVGPGAEKGTGRVLVAGGRGWRSVGESGGSIEPKAVSEAAAAVRGDLRAEDGRADVVGLMNSWLYRAEKDRGCDIRAVADGVDRAWLDEAIERWARGAEAEIAGGEKEDRVIEVDGTGRG